MKLSLSLIGILLLSAAPVLAAEPAATPPTKAEPNQITISKYKFVPDTLNIVAGTKVTWINRDEVPHTIVDGAKPKTFHSGALDTNESFSLTFANPGTFHYFCTLHPQMVGTVIVAAPK